MNIQEVLKQVQEGTLSAEQAEAMLREEHFAGKTAAKKTLMENDFAEMAYRICGSCVLQWEKCGTVGVHLSTYL